MGDNSPINLGKLSKPATVLIEKVSDAVGGICKPWQTVRVAKAERKADLIRAGGEIEITELHQRAAQRWLVEEAKKQENIESITALAIKDLDEDADPAQISSDWVTNFFDKSRIISDIEMQKLWGRLLAAEANSPGDYSKRTVNLIGDMDRADAELFERLCGYTWWAAGENPIIFDHNNPLYTDNGVDFEALAHLESLGLIQFDLTTNYVRTNIHETLTVRYFNHSAVLQLGQASANRLDVGSVIFTRAGQEMSTVCRRVEIPGIFEYVTGVWAQRGVTQVHD